MDPVNLDELRQAQAALAASAARLSLVLKGANDGWWDWDLVNDQIFYSPRWWSMIGYQPDEVPADTALWRRLVHPEDAEATERVFGQALADGPDNYEVEFRLRHKDGHYVPVLSRGHIVRDASGRPVRVSGSNFDLTARRNEEQALRNSELDLRALLEAMTDGVFVAQDYRFVFVNRALAALLGHARDQVAGLDFDAVLAPESVDLFRQRFQARVAEGPEPQRRYETCFVTNTGQRLAIDLRVSRLMFGGRPGVLGLVRDITDQKQAEATRMQLEARLRDAQKMEAVGTLAGGVAHDFNNVLAAILGNLALARQDLGGDHPAQAPLQRVQMAALRARSLVQQILTFSRRHPAQPQQARQPLRPIVEESLGLLRVTLPANVRLTALLGEAPLHAEFDPTQMQQVLMNLCTNAWHALQGRAGHLEVGLDEWHATADLAVPSPGLAPGRWAHLWVRDDGCGMDAACRARIFEPFFTTKPVGEGTGLGLAVVHGIVGAHGGAITVESEPGRGSCFRVYLPLSLHEDPPSIAAAVPDAPAGAGQSVVYVDDDEVILITVEQLLRRAGYRVTCFQEGAAAIAALRTDSQVADLVVTDFNMPGLSGLDVARELARLRPELPVVISSGYLAEALRDEARALGVRMLMNKENTVEELTGVVHRVLSEARS